MMSRESRRKRRKWLAIALTLSTVGCTSITNPDQGKKTNFGGLSMLLPGGDHSPKVEATGSERILNPPARTIRFDGHEIVLGNGEVTNITSDQLAERLRPLIEKKRIRSAERLALQNYEACERLLAERWATSPNAPEIKLIADIQSKRSQAASDGNWNSLLTLAIANPDKCRTYVTYRNAFALTLQKSDPSEQAAAQLQDSALQVNHPLVTIDSKRLLGLRAFVAERWNESETHYRSAIEASEKSVNSGQASELRLMLAETARRKGASEQVASEWSAALALQIKLMSTDTMPLNTGFWLRADQLRPVGFAWPSELSTALSRINQRVGCGSSGSPEMHLWSAIAQSQYDRGDMQLALVNFKKAETLASGSDAMWLRIGQSRCLSALDQIPAATAILSGPATSSDVNVAAAATAALGSTKLRSGAYQQGAQLLNKALTQTSTTAWASRAQAEADLAIAQLIIGETEQGLKAMHRAQAQFSQVGDIASLVQSLDNEMRLLQHEGRNADFQQIEERILEVERR